MVSQKLKQITTQLAVVSTILALVVIVLGAYARLTDSGLGCPDWPGCYGQLTVPDQSEEILTANQLYPERPFDEAKAWPEMVHRYFASGLGLIISIIFILSLINRQHPAQPTKLSSFVFLLVIFQGMLGMWTVTLKLYPPVVMGHLLGGFTIFTLLLLMSLRSSQVLQPTRDDGISKIKPWALIALILVILQIALGGWTAANYSALICTQLPICQGDWSSHLNFSEAFKLWHMNDQDFEFAPHLSESAQLTIHISHRIGAIVVGTYLYLLSIFMYFKASRPRYRYFAIALFVVVTLQIALGVSNVVMGLPLKIAVSHNAFGAILLALILTLNYSIRKKH